MDCLDARACFPLLTLPAIGELPAELQAAQQHVEQCTACRSALRREEVGDWELSRQISAVSLPDGLSARLQQRIAVQYALLSTAPPARLGRRSWFWGTVATAVMLALITPWLVQTLSPTLISTADLLAIIGQNRNDADWPVVQNREFPIGWSDSVQLITQPYHRNSEAPVPLFVAKFDFRPSRSAEPVSGTLWMMDANSLSNVGELPTLEAAQIQYSPGLLVWKEGSVIFIVAMDGRTLDHLQRKLLRSRSMA